MATRWRKKKEEETRKEAEAEEFLDERFWIQDVDVDVDVASLLLEENIKDSQEGRCWNSS